MEPNEQDSQAAPGSDRVQRTERFHSRLYRYQLLLRRLWWVVASTIALGVLAKLIMVELAPTQYVSTGQMIVSIRLTLPEGSVYTEEWSNFLGTQMSLMQNAAVRSRATAALEKDRPDLLPCPVELRVSVIPKTTIFVVRGTGIEEEYVQAYVDACMNAYTELKREMRSQTSETTLASITEELGVLERTLQRNEEELANFQTSNSVVLLQKQGSSASAYLADLNRQVADLRTEYRLLGALSLEQNLERRQFAGSQSGQDALQPADSEYLRDKQELALLKAEMQELSEHLRARHPKMVKIADDIVRRERVLELYREQSKEQLESRRRSLEVQLRNLEEQVAEWEGRSIEASRKIAQFERIQGNKDRTQALYERLLSTMQTLDVNKDLSSGNVSVLEPAAPARTDLDSLPWGLAVAGLLGLAAGLGILLLVDRLDDRINSFTEFEENFEEDVAGQIPHDPEAQRGTAIHLSQEDDRHALVEAFRNLRSSLLFRPVGEKPPRLLLITSSIPGEGKSMTAANLAITIAHGGMRVLLVDADLRKGELHRRFGMESGEGLSEMLAGGPAWSSIVQTTRYPNLDLLPRGSATQRSSELFLGPNFAAFMREARERYDQIILDTPPVMAADDASSLAPQADGVIFVLRARKTSGRVMRAALELLYQRSTKVLGVVLNDVKASSANYYYYRYKDYYSSFPSK